MDKTIAYQLIKKENKSKVLRCLFLLVFYIPIAALTILYSIFIVLLNIFKPSNIVEFYYAVFHVFVDIFRAFKYSVNPKKYQPIALYDGDVSEIGSIEFNKKEFFVETENFIVFNKKLSFEVIPKAFIVWAYLEQEKNTTRMGHGGSIVSSNKVNSLILKTSYNKTYKILINVLNFINAKDNRKIDDYSIYKLLENLSNTAVVGYNPKYESLYKKDAKNFINLLREV